MMRFENETTLREARRTWRAFHVFDVLCETGVTRLLDTEVSQPLGLLAERAGVMPRQLRTCLDVLVASGVLHYDGEGYRLTRDGPSVVAAFEEMRHEVAALRDLPDALVEGKPHQETVGGVAIDDPVDQRRFLSGLRRRALPSGPEATRLVRRAWEGQGIVERPPRVLDLGGGHGYFASSFAAALPGADVVLFDQPLVEPFARELSGDSFSVRTGDYLEDDLGGPYDVAFVSNVVHQECPERAARLLRHLRRAMRPGGYVVVRDRFVHDDRTGPDWATDFGITLLLYTFEGHTRTLGEMRGLLTDAGFADAVHHAAPADEYAYMIARARS